MTPRILIDGRWWKLRTDSFGMQAYIIDPDQSPAVERCTHGVVLEDFCYQCDKEKPSPKVEGGKWFDDPDAAYASCSPERQSSLLKAYYVKCEELQKSKEEIEKFCKRVCLTCGNKLASEETAYCNPCFLADICNLGKESAPQVNDNRWFIRNAPVYANVSGIRCTPNEAKQLFDAYHAQKAELEEVKQLSGKWEYLFREADSRVKELAKRPAENEGWTELKNCDQGFYERVDGYEYRLCRRKKAEVEPVKSNQEIAEKLAAQNIGNGWTDIFKNLLDAVDQKIARRVG